MIYKELSEEHFYNLDVKKILISNSTNQDNLFYDQIIDISYIDNLISLTKDSFFFIDLKSFDYKQLMDLITLLVHLKYFKVFLMFSPPKFPLCKREVFSSNSSIQSINFGKKSSVILILNTVFLKLSEIISLYKYDEIVVYVPFPSYYPYDREHIITKLFGDNTILDKKVKIVQFNSTNPYDIYYKLSILKSQSYDYILCCDKLIFSGAISYLSKNNVEYTLFINKDIPFVLCTKSKFYEISDLI